jgi:phosphoglycolate phosphatase
MHQLQARDAGRIHVFPGLREVLGELHARGLVLALVTSNAEANVRRTLGPDVTALIDHLACGRPLFGKAAAFKRLLRATGVPPAQAIVVGDELRDAQAAHEAGLAFAAVSWGYTRRDALAATSPVLLADRVEDLLALAPRR